MGEEMGEEMEEEIEEGIEVVQVVEAVKITLEEVTQGMKIEDLEAMTIVDNPRVRGVEEIEKMVVAQEDALMELAGEEIKIPMILVLVTVIT